MARQISREEWIQRFGATRGIGRHRMAGEVLAEAAQPRQDAYAAVAVGRGETTPFDFFPTEDAAWRALHDPGYNGLIPLHDEIVVMPTDQAMELMRQEQAELMVRRTLANNPYDVY